MSRQIEYPAAIGRKWLAARLRGTVFVAAFALLLAGMPGEAHAYVGPGAGITMLGAMWAVVAAVVVAVGGILIWPVRALLRRRKRQATPETRSSTEEAEPK